MNPDSSVKVRVATSDDVHKIIQISEAIYNGGDYLPVVLHQWLTEERRFIFLAEYQGEVIGLQVATVAIDQESFVTQSLRIHPKYRGKKLSYQLTDAVTREMCTRFPQTSKHVLTCMKSSAAFKMYTNKGG
ncbi:Histidine N-acetyltransferase [Exaiptasia diaphana]|nr:Histidine N-acetyltransferase [Exaiptasia diaphana]